MSAIDADAGTTLRDQVQALSDRAEIAQLCDRYVMHLDWDRDNDEWLGSVFTDDAHLAFPMGEYQGLGGIAEFQEMGRRNYTASHHISANNYIELDGDRARVRVHLVAVHVGRREEPGRHFDLGGHYDAEAVRTPAGWRFRRFTFSIVWHSGETPAELAS
jgi:SnoaL-like domain